MPLNAEAQRISVNEVWILRNFRRRVIKYFIRHMLYAMCRLIPNIIAAQKEIDVIAYQRLKLNTGLVVNEAANFIIHGYKYEQDYTFEYISPPLVALNEMRLVSYNCIQYSVTTDTWFCTSVLLMSELVTCGDLHCRWLRTVVYSITAPVHISNWRVCWQPSKSHDRNQPEHPSIAVI